VEQRYGYEASHNVVKGQSAAVILHELSVHFAGVAAGQVIGVGQF
jgi:hypothetical protein